MVRAHAAQALLDAAAGADLLVVGCRGHGGFTGMLLGSTSQHVVAHAPRPVLVVHAEEQATSTSEIQAVVLAPRPTAVVRGHVGRGPAGLPRWIAEQQCAPSGDAWAAYLDEPGVAEPRTVVHMPYRAA